MRGCTSERRRVQGPSLPEEKRGKIKERKETTAGSARTPTTACRYGEWRAQPLSPTAVQLPCGLGVSAKSSLATG